jgi:hypothetical protein
MASIGFTSSDPFLEGVQAGVARTGRDDLLARVWDDQTLVSMAAQSFRDFLEAPHVREVFEPPLGVARGMLEREDASARFTEFFAEMLTVAVIARRAYDDAALAESDIESYLQHSFWIFNSFRHA